MAIQVKGLVSGVGSLLPDADADAVAVAARAARRMPHAVDRSPLPPSERITHARIVCVPSASAD